MKASPASVLGTSWVSAMRGPFPDQRFVVTGGMTINLVSELLNAGARTVALSAAFDSDESIGELGRAVRAAGSRQRPQPRVSTSPRRRIE